MDRRSFLRRTSLALPALLVGDAALEAFERLTHRKVFALGHPLPQVRFWVDKIPDRSFLFYGADVTDAFGKQVTYQHSATLMHFEGWPQAQRRGALRSQLAYQIAKLGQRVEKGHGIPLASMVPAMDAAVA